MPLFSIIMPTYNSESTIQDVLNSIKEQTFNDFEIIIVDGASQDSTIQVIQDFNNTLDQFNLFLISEKDKGIYDAMNKGIKIAKGKWLYFIGADDTFYSNDVLSQISGAIKNNPDKDIIYGNVISERFNGIYDGPFDFHKLKQKNICHQAIFFKKNLFNKMGLFSTKYKAWADWDFNLRCFGDPKVATQYVNLIIASYADGGFSSTFGDSKFSNDKNFLFIKYDKRSLSSTYRKLKTFKEFIKIKIGEV